MIVIDASAIIEVLVDQPGESLAVRLSTEGTLHAPHLLDTEVLHVLRRLRRDGALTDAQAADARRHFATLQIGRHPHAPLSVRVWALRSDVTAHDATDVALAEMLDALVVTVDARSAPAPGVSEVVHLFGRTNFTSQRLPVRETMGRKPFGHGKRRPMNFVHGAARRNGDRSPTVRHSDSRDLPTTSMSGPTIRVL